MATYLKNPKQIILLGYPLGHSFSPILHNFAFQYLQFDYIYTAFPIEPARLSELGPDFLKILPFCGGNITIPFKEKIFNCLDHVSPEAGQIGAVNTFYKKDGLLYGDNTDMYGFIQSVKGLEDNFSGKKVLLLGTGGSAKAVSAALARLQAEEIVVVSRALESAVVFTGNRREAFPKISWTAMDYQSLMSYNGVSDIAVVINATPVGMSGDVSSLPEPVIERLSGDTIVYDLIYNPACTRLLLLAGQKGLKTINGINMLINQAGKAFQLWTGHQFPVLEAENLLKEHFLK